MPASLASLCFVILILGLFWLDRDRRVRNSAAITVPVIWLSVGKRRAAQWLQTTRRAQAHKTSRALWIPVVWFLLACSRSVSEWAHGVPPGATTEALLEGDPLNRLVYAALVAGGLSILAFRGQRVFRLLQSNVLIVVFLLYCALSLTWAEYPDVGFKRWVKAIGDFVMVLIVLSDPDPALAARRLLTRVGFILIPLSVLMIKYYPGLARYYDRWDWSTYYSGVTTNKNALGVLCLLYGLASVWQIIGALSGRKQTGRVRRILAHGIVLGMALWLFKFANSMTSLACFALGLCMLVMLEFRPVLRNPLVVHVFVASLILVPIMVLFAGLGPGILHMMGKDPTLTDRTLIWDMLLNMTPSAWVGTGFENFWLGPRLDQIWAVYTWAPNQAHNGYVETYLNLGWVGIGLVVLILFTSYRKIMAGLRQSTPIAKLMLTYFVVGIVYNFTEAALFRILTPAWLVLLLAIVKVPGTKVSEQRQPATVQRPVAKRMTAYPLGAMTRAADARQRIR
jgi:exopolysaccharide production protein ExoQ